ncbi:MSHA biogenesis protein MshJ [Undibacterium sp.]|uniref:MSHA biogenesis protein MshJ n=1 Tax=Undibacterium sp. TaxID=1914977 RepID=UPI0025CBB6B4|nr:MSHA biogenesis protein MshJ [Undibacterium sp.]
MKQQWAQIAAKIDALSLRERGIMLAVLAVAIIFIVNTFIIDPQFRKQKMLADQMKTQRAQIAAIQAEIAQRIVMKNQDPDLEIKRILQVRQTQLAQMSSNLLELHKNLVQPEKMAALLENLLKRNRSLQLLSLNSMPAVNVVDALDEAATTAAQINKSNLTAQTARPKDGQVQNLNDTGIVYKHEMELVVQGGYLELLSYLRELEALPESVYWSKGQLSVIEYPQARLQLKIFTLSLEKKWLNL